MKPAIFTVIFIPAGVLLSGSACTECAAAIAQDEVNKADVNAPEVSPRRRAVDLVVLKDGRRVFGVFLHPPKAGADHVLVVSTEWLSQELPDDWNLIRQQWAGETAEDGDGKRERVAEFRDVLRQAGQLTQELEVYLDDAGAPPAEPRDGSAIPRLVQLSIDSRLVQQVLVQPSPRRKLAVIAMSNGLSSVETREYLELSGEVRNKQLTPRQLPLPGSHEDAENAEFEKWKAFTRFVFVDQTRLVQYGESVFDRDAEVPMEALLSQMLQQQTQQTLQQLLNEGLSPTGRTPGGTKTSGDTAISTAARRRAEESGAETFLLQRLRISSDQRGGGVDLVLAARDPVKEQWKTVWKTTVPIDVNRVTPAEQTELADNPQLRDLSAILDQLGIDDRTLDQSFQFGAAVQKAIADADQQFLETRDRVLFQKQSDADEIRAARITERKLPER